MGTREENVDATERKLLFSPFSIAAAAAFHPFHNKQAHTHTHTHTCHHFLPCYSFLTCRTNQNELKDGEELHPADMGRRRRGDVFLHLHIRTAAEDVPPLRGGGGGGGGGREGGGEREVLQETERKRGMGG